MIASRSALIAQRAVRVGRSRIAVRRYAADNTPKPATSGAASGALTGGLIGGGVSLLVGYGFYHFSGAKTAVQTAQQAKGYVDSAFDSIKLQLPEGKPSAGDAIQTLRDTANKYAAFVPGGRGYVDSAFHDIEAIRKQHGDEVDKIVSEAYAELQDVSKKGFSMEAAGETVNVLIKHLSRLSSLAGDAAKDIINEHPQLKEKVGGSVDQLKELSERYGPEAKKQAQEVQDQIRDIMKSGFQMDTVAKVQKLVQEKTEQIRQMGEEALNKGMEEIKPMLEKNPKVKELVEGNMSALKDGNVTEVINKVRKAVFSGETGDLEKYINQAKEKGSGQLSQWLGAIPDGSQVLSQFQTLQKLAQSKGREAEQLLKETITEIKQVLDNKIKKADQIKKDAENEK